MRYDFMYKMRKNWNYEKRARVRFENKIPPSVRERNCSTRKKFHRAPLRANRDEIFGRNSRMDDEANPEDGWWDEPYRNTYRRTLENVTVRISES